MLKIKITWPVVILILFAIAAWLMRSQQPTQPARSRRTPRQTIILNGDGDAYDAETDRLDREAAQAGRATYETESDRYTRTINRMRKRNAERYANRTSN